MKITACLLIFHSMLDLYSSVIVPQYVLTYLLPWMLLQFFSSLVTYGNIARHENVCMCFLSKFICFWTKRKKPVNRCCKIKTHSSHSVIVKQGGCNWAIMENHKFPISYLGNHWNFGSLLKNNISLPFSNL